MEEIIKKLQANEDRSKSNTHRIDELERRQDDLDKIVNTVAVIANEQEHIKVDVTEIKKDVKLLADKPAKRWDGVVDKIIMVVVGAVIAYILTGIGL